MIKEAIEVSVRATNPALKDDLLKAVEKSFKASPRGLLAAIKFGRDQNRETKASCGNLSRPVIRMKVAGKSVRFWDAVSDCTDENGDLTVARAAKALSEMEG